MNSEPASDHPPCQTPDQCNSAAVADAMAHVTRIYIAGLLIVGLFGNAYCVTAFLMPDYRRIPSSLYLSALALSDIGFLLTLGFMWLQSIGLQLLDMARMCSTCMFLSYFCCFVSGWLVMAVTLERYFLSRGMGNPNVDGKECCGWTCWRRKEDRRGSYSSNTHHRRVRITFAGIILFGLITNSWVLFAAESVQTVLQDENGTMVIDQSIRGPVVCDVSQATAGRLYPIFNALDMIFSFTLPFIGVLILNLKIGFRVCKAQDLARRKTEEGGRHRNGDSEMARIQSNVATESTLRDEQVEETQLIHGQMSVASAGIARRRGSRARTIEMRVTKLLVTVSMAYLILNLPSYVHRIVFAFDHPTGSQDSSTEAIEAFVVKGSTEIIAETLSYLMFYTQFSINFFLYSCHGCMFGFVC